MASPRQVLLHIAETQGDVVGRTCLCIVLAASGGLHASNAPYGKAEWNGMELGLLATALLIVILTSFCLAKRITGHIQIGHRGRFLAVSPVGSRMRTRSRRGRWSKNDKNRLRHGLGNQPGTGPVWDIMQASHVCNLADHISKGRTIFIWEEVELHLEYRLHLEGSTIFLEFCRCDGCECLLMAPRTRTEGISSVPRPHPVPSQKVRPTVRRGPGRPLPRPSQVAALAQAPQKVERDSPDADAESRNVRNSPRVVLTSQLAARLLKELLEAFQRSASVEEAKSTVGASWGFRNSAEMTRCIEAQANASLKP
eukprot:symbB.v1.2.029150.t1/scaffold3149.1/size62434/3